MAILYKDYWFRKLKAYQDAGVLVKSGVLCPQDGLELWSTITGDDVRGILKDGRRVLEISQTFAICANGHRHEL